MTSHQCFKTQEQVSSYDKNSKLQYIWAAQTINKYQDIFKNAKRIVEIGCGNAKITMELVQKAAPNAISITAIDKEESMIELAKSKYPDSDVNFVRKDVEEFDFSGYDLAFSNCCLHWLVSQENAITRIANGLDRDGYFIVVLPGKKVIQGFNISVVIANKPFWKPYFANLKPCRSYYTKDEYAELLNKIGLHVIDIFEEDTDIHYKDENELKDWYKPVSPHYNHLEELELKQKFLDEWIEEALKIIKYEENTGDIIYTSLKLVALCKK